MNIWNEFHGPNAGYVVELYERYRRDPQSVDPAARELLERWTPPEVSGTGNGAKAAGATAPQAAGAADPAKIVGAANLAQAIRGLGHLAAQLDPLGSPPPGDPLLVPASHGLTEDELRALPASLI